MKLLFLLLLPFFSIAQQKGANVIKVSNVSFDQCVSALIADGFIIDRIDKEYKVITTKPLEVKKAGTVIILQVNQKDSALMIRGQLSETIGLVIGGQNIKSESSRIVNKGMRGSVNKLCFDRMNDFARSLGGEVSYIVQ